MSADAVVIGAGPAGTTMAGRLAKLGYSVLVFEKADFPGKNKACGGALPEKFFKKLELPKDVIEKESRKLVVHFPDESIELPSNGVVLFDREKFDSFLAQKAAENGAKILVSTTVFDVTKRGYETTIHYKRRSEDKPGKVRTRLVIFADGAETLAPKKMKIGFQRKPDHAALAATYDVKCLNHLRDSLDFFVTEKISPFGYGWIFPKQNTMNVGVICLLSKLKQNIKHHLDQLMISQKLEARDVVKYGCRLVPQSVVRKIYGDSALSVGDAAGTADPISGGGISNAIVSAEIAAEIAGRALQVKKVTADLLKDYELRWKQTKNYSGLVSGHRMQTMALKMGVNPAVFLKLSAIIQSKSAA
jgi:digeranylgeranylglycerophospholipid reductase